MVANLQVKVLTLVSRHFVNLAPNRFGFFDRNLHVIFNQKMVTVTRYSNPTFRNRVKILVNVTIFWFMPVLGLKTLYNRSLVSIRRRPTAWHRITRGFGQFGFYSNPRYRKILENRYIMYICTDET